jgi:hypothetical protein
MHGMDNFKIIRIEMLPGPVPRFSLSYTRIPSKHGT